MKMFLIKVLQNSFQVVTQDGWLFDKEAVLKYMIEKKQEYSRKLKEYERQKIREEQEQKESEEVARNLAVEKFEKSEKNILQKNKSAGPAGPSGSGTSAGLPSFWIPQLTPQAEKTKLVKPDKTVYCPMSGKPLKMKDLINVKFKEIRDGDDDTVVSSDGKTTKKRSLISKVERYVCAVTNDVLVRIVKVRLFFCDL
jgi:nitric oxide synthase-interacting protein